MAQRTTITMSPKLEKIIVELAEKEHTTKSDIIRKALALYNYLYTQVEENQTQVVVSGSTGTKGDPQKVVLIS